jgi:ABC-type uncharacterized transport system involved in gliding motility auxiliary subunit
MDWRPIKNLAFILLLFVGAIALYQLAARHPLQWDITRSANNSLDRSSVEVLRQLPGEVKLTVFSTGRNARGDDLRKLIRDFIALYQRYKPDISLQFVDPALHPEEVRKADIQANGEMLVEYAGRSEHLTTLSEPALSGVLLRLAHSGNRLLLYLDGHGERKLDGVANRDLGDFGKRLQQDGYRIGSLNLTIAQDVPANASTLVITQPQVDLLPGETDKLLSYIDSGGNLLWLIDADPLHGLEPLADKLGLHLTPGIVIDPAAEEMRAPASWALGTVYPPHAVTHNFNLVTVFPFARALGWKENHEWQHSALVEAAPRGWVSTDISSPKPRFNKTRDVPGPAIVALALQRTINHREQRIIVVGGGSFLANAYSGNGGNINLGINMLNWLANEDRLIAIQPSAAGDSSISLSKTQLSFISIGLVIVLPLLLILVGGVLWWRRRR